MLELAPVAHALDRAGAQHLLVHTGQHHDAAMPDVFFRDWGIAAPAVQLHVGSGSHGTQTAAMLAALEPALADESPDWVLVYADTSSTLAAAIVAVELHVPLAHLEAGLRSHNGRMPTPCATIRTETEWPETLSDGWNVLDPSCVNLAASAARARPTVAVRYPCGRGRAAEEVVAALQAGEPVPTSRLPCAPATIPPRTRAPRPIPAPRPR